MNSVLGVSVGSTAIHLARTRRAVGSMRLDSFELQSVGTTYQRLPELVAESIRSAMDTTATVATVVAYRGESEAATLRAVLQRNHSTDYILVPETEAVLEYLAHAEEVGAHRKLVVYDLGGSGLTISVVDTVDRVVQYAERTDEISGDLFDALIRDHQITSGSVAAPHSPEGFVELDARCREGKEQLSVNPAASLPSDRGLVLFSRENFEAMIAASVAASARMTVEVIRSATQSIDAVVAVGGSVRIPAIRTHLREAVGLPVIVPAGPESVCARGATLLARKSVSSPVREASVTSTPLRRVVPPPVPAAQSPLVAHPGESEPAVARPAESAMPYDEPVAEADSQRVGLDSAAVLAGRSGPTGFSATQAQGPDAFPADWLSQPDPATLWYSSPPRKPHKRKLGSSGITAAVIGGLVVIGGIGVGLGLGGGKSSPPHDAVNSSTVVPTAEPTTETPSFTLPSLMPTSTVHSSPSLPPSSVAAPPPPVNSDHRAPAPEAPVRVQRAPAAPRRPAPGPPAAGPKTYVLPLPGAPTVVVPPNVMPYR